jgi:hypothetical protein
MDSGRIRRLRFTLSDRELNGIIDLLSDFGACWLHRNAWEILMSEMEQRQDGQPPRDIELMSGVFDTLPPAIQAMLRNHMSTEPRRVA